MIFILIRMNDTFKGNKHNNGALQTQYEKVCVYILNIKQIRNSGNISFITTTYNRAKILPISQPCFKTLYLNRVQPKIIQYNISGEIK